MIVAGSDLCGGLGWLAREWQCFGNEPGHSPGFDKHTRVVYTHRHIHKRLQQREVSGLVVRAGSGLFHPFTASFVLWDHVTTITNLSEWQDTNTVHLHNLGQENTAHNKVKMRTSSGDSGNLWSSSAHLLSQRGVIFPAGRHPEKRTLLKYPSIFEDCSPPTWHRLFSD